MAKKDQDVAVPAKTQTELDHTPEELAHMGAMYSADRLGAGARDRLGYVKEDAAILGPVGFDAAWIALMTPKVKAISDQKNVRISMQSAARPSGATAQGLFEEMEDYLKRAHGIAGILPKAVAALAPLVPHNGKRPATISGTVRAYVKFFADHDAETKAHGGGSAFATAGQNLADAYDAARTGHKVDLSRVNPEVFALHVDEGIVAGELERLSHVAQSLVSHERSKLYALTDLHPRPSGKKKGAPGAPTSASTPQ